MYEFKQGSARLVYALDQRKEDPEIIRQLSHWLNYNAPQLQQDIQALTDYYDQSRKHSDAAQIKADPRTGACTLDGEQLHCGQRLEVLICQDGALSWETVRFELDGDDRPYFPGYRGTQVSGLFARLPEDLR